MTDVEESRVIDVAPGHSEQAADSLWNSLSEAQREQIAAVAIDMSQALENSARKNALNAAIVHDRFHIGKHLTESVDKVRRDEHRALLEQGDRRLIGSRELWLDNPENIPEPRQDDFTALRRQELKTFRAWSIKEYFRWFWSHADADSGKEFFDDWYSWAIRSRLEPVKRVARMLKRRLANILTWFRHRITNAVAEGFNSRIQSIKSAARGFRDFGNDRTRILFFCGKLDLKPPVR